jgi:flavin reductase (DIM6/NTAB) family NADH-FMN oxidoreductase RutF
MKTIDPKNISVGALHQFLLGSVAPRPIAFASTIDELGRPNLAPFSFFNVFSANPPILIFSPARSGRDNTTKHTYENVKKVPEVVVNVVDYQLVHQCSLASTAYDEGVNEFVKAGLTPIPSEVVRPFRVKESPVQMECIVKQVIELGHEGGAGNLVIAEVVRMHIADHVLTEDGKIDPLKMDLVGRCGGDFYSRTNSEALFEVAKPIQNMGIGVDQLPADVRESNVLTGNNLAQLANVEHVPDETEVNEYKLTELADLFIELSDEPIKLEMALHTRAKVLLDKNDINSAWLTLLTFNNG